MFKIIVNWIIRRAQRTPYHKGHLVHADGSLYMSRRALFETRWMSARVHHIATPDSDCHLHDHPWPFISILMRGSYMERRPVEVDPCFIEGADVERHEDRARHAGSIAFRRATDRHAITRVSRDVWTLFITFGRPMQWWGFYTRQGKVYFKDYAAQSDAPISAVTQGQHA